MMRTKRSKNAREVADLIERFLENRSTYPQEWNDFVDSSQRDERIDKYRKRCSELDPLVNAPGPQNPSAVAELRKMVCELRESDA